MKAGFYQSNPAFGSKEENFREVFGAVSRADLDLLVLPEFFAAGYQFRSKEEVAALSEVIPGGATTEFLLELARAGSMHVVAGLPERAGERLYNSAVLVGPKGVIGLYRKTHLFFEEKLYFSPGDTGFRAWDLPWGRLGVMICFDWFFPESLRTLALMGAEVVAHPSNLVLPYCPRSMPTRCLENRVYAVTANRIGTEDRKEGHGLTFIGQSRIVAPDGSVLAEGPERDLCLGVAEIEPSRARAKALNPYNDLFADRRPEMYLTRPER